MNFPKGSSHLNRLKIEIKGLGNKSKISKCTEKNILNNCIWFNNYYESCTNFPSDLSN